MTTRQPDSMTCLAQADLLLLLAQMLKTPATWANVDRQVSNEDVDALSERSGLARFPRGGELLRRAVDEWETVDTQAAEAQHSRLFEGPLVCPPNETMYDRRDKGAILADIAGFYRAFGFELADGFREKHDHIVAEVQFAAMLLVLVGRAGDLDRSEQRDVAQHALTGFLSDHLGVWIGSFVERLETTSALPFYTALSRVLAAAWEAVRADQDLADTDDRREPVGEEPGTPYECGLCPAATETDPGR